MIRPGSLPTSSISARSVQKTSGLFNDGPADDLKTNFKPSAEDFLSSIDSGSDALMLGLDSGMLSYLDPLAEASLDSFVDISTFFAEGKLDEPMDGAADIESLVQKNTEPDIEEPATPSMKRKFDEVEVVDVVDMEEEVVVTTTPDHDYVSKRPRLSTSSNISEESISISVTSSPAPVVVEQKYRERRNKNNVASRRSREIRKQKFVDMEAKADSLVIENEKLSAKIVELEKLAKDMKAILVAKLAGK